MAKEIDITSLASLVDDEPEVTVASLIQAMESEEDEATEKVVDITVYSTNHIGRLTELPINSLSAFPEQPFKPYVGDKLNNLTQSIEVNGVLTPIVVRALSDSTYQIISGHNRVNACKALSIDTIPCIVKELDDDQAWIELIENNLNQRQDLLPSERAWAYRIRQEKIGRKVGRPSTINKSCHEWHDLSENSLNTSMDGSRRTLYRYIRLTYLLSDLLELVDNEVLSVVVGEELSYLNNDNQSILFEWLKSGIKINPAMASKIKKSAEEETLTVEMLKTMFQKSEPVEKSQFVLKMSPIRKIIGKDISQKDLTALIIELLKKHYIKEEKEHDN